MIIDIFRLVSVPCYLISVFFFFKISFSSCLLIFMNLYSLTLYKYTNLFSSSCAWWSLIMSLLLDLWVSDSVIPSSVGPMESPVQWLCCYWCQYIVIPLLSWACNSQMGLYFWEVLVLGFLDRHLILFAVDIVVLQWQSPSEHLYCHHAGSGTLCFDIFSIFYFVLIFN